MATAEEEAMGIAEARAPVVARRARRVEVNILVFVSKGCMVVRVVDSVFV